MVANLASPLGSVEQFQQEVVKGNITGALALMQTRKELLLEALSQYDPSSHDVMKRPDKVIRGKDSKTGKETIRTEKTWKLPIPYQVYINEIALVFLYGRPVVWNQLSAGTDAAFKEFGAMIKRTHFDAKLRECKRIAGAETQSAMLFRVYGNQERKNADLQIRVLAASKGDDISVLWDEYENMRAFAWGHHVADADGHTRRHVEIYTAETIFSCVEASSSEYGWEVTPKDNVIGKIPVILFEQEVEWAGVERLIHRQELITSKTSDTNDYFSDPKLMLNADLVKNLPNKDDSGQVLVVKGQESIENAAKYMTWDSAPESKKQEIERLDELIHMMSFTPKISLETLKSVSQLSAKALKSMMMLADIKASRRKEKHDELLDRAASLMISVIGRATKVALAKECEKLEVGHEFQSPFGEDVAEVIDNINKSVEGGSMSQLTALEKNPLISDPIGEKKRLDEEASQRASEREALFGDLSAADIQPAFGGQNKQPKSGESANNGENE